MNRKIHLFLTVFAALFAVTSCKPKKDMVYLSKNSEAQIQSEITHAKFEGLKIQEGDKLQIVVSAFDEIAVRPFNQNSMAGTTGVAAGGSGGSAGSAGTGGEAGYTVTPDGYIAMPVLGRVFVKGMTKTELKHDLENRLRAYLTDPMVTVTLTNFNFTILGEVGGTGQKTSATEKLNIFQAIALAGDLKPTANRTNVRVIRTAGEGQESTGILDLTDAAVMNSPYYYIQQNDIIYVEPDRNTQIAARTSPQIDQILKYSGIGFSVLSLILLLFRRK